MESCVLALEHYLKLHMQTWAHCATTRETSSFGGGCNKSGTQPPTTFSGSTHKSKSVHTALMKSQGRYFVNCAGYQTSPLFSPRNQLLLDRPLSGSLVVARCSSAWQAGRCANLLVCRQDAGKLGSGLMISQAR